MILGAFFVKGVSIMIYLGALALGFSIWMLVGLNSPHLTRRKETMYFCALLTGIFLFAAAIFEVQVGIIASVNEVISIYADLFNEL